MVVTPKNNMNTPLSTSQKKNLGLMTRKGSQKSIVVGENSVKVAVRCRPLSQRELDKGATDCVSIEENSITIGPLTDGDHNGDPGTPGSSNGNTNTPTRNARRSVKRQFSFDFCYGKDSQQDDVFQDIGKGVLENAFAGYNASVFAYGQTGSGKTHTMLGDEKEEGLIPRICQVLVDKLDKSRKQSLDEENAVARASSTRYNLQASYLEIYNERCIDLLCPNKENLRIREHPTKGPYVEDLLAIPVKTMEDITRLMDVGAKARTVASTNMNHQSSRSHAIFTLVFTQTNIASDLCSATDTVSKINLVDLAGSERVNASGVQGKHLKEAANINRSLHTLGRVINALSEASSKNTPQKNGSGKKKENMANAVNSPGVNEAVIPYRDSTLTWLLKPSLGGNSKTTMLAAVSPANYNYDETVTTLRYAQQCARVINRAVVNRDANNQVIAELRQEIDLLRERLAIQAEASTAMMTENEMLQQDKENVERLHIEHKLKIEQEYQEIQKRCETLESEKTQFQQEISNLNRDKMNLTQVNQKNDIELVDLRLTKTHLEREVTNSSEKITQLEKSIEEQQQAHEQKIQELTQNYQKQKNQTLQEYELNTQNLNRQIQELTQEVESKVEVLGIRDASIAQLENTIKEKEQELEKEAKRHKAALSAVRNDFKLKLEQSQQQFDEKVQQLENLNQQDRDEHQRAMEELRETFNQEKQALGEQHSQVIDDLNQANATEREGLIQKHQQQIDAKEKEVDGLKSELQQLGEAKQNLDSELAALNSKLEETSAKLVKENEDKQQLEHEKQSLEGIIDDLTDKQDKLAEKAKTLQEAIDQLTTEKEKLEQDNTEFQETIEALTAEKATLIKEGETMQQSIDELNAEKTALMETNEKLQETINTLDSEKTALTERTQELQESIDDLKLQQENLTAKNAALQESLDASQSSNEDLKAQLEQLKEEKASLLQELEQTKANAESTEKQLSLEKDELKIQMEEQQMKADEEIASRDEKMTCLEQEFASVKEQLSNQLADREALLDVQKHQIANLQKEIEVKSNHYDHLVQETTIERESKDGEIANLQNDLSTLKETMEKQQIDHNNVVFDLNTRLEQKEQEHKALETEHGILTSHHEHANEEIDGLRKELHSTTQALEESKTLVANMTEENRVAKEMVQMVEEDRVVTRQQCIEANEKMEKALEMETDCGNKFEQLRKEQEELQAMLLQTSMQEMNMQKRLEEINHTESVWQKERHELIETKLQLRKQLLDYEQQLEAQKKAEEEEIEQQLQKAQARMKSLESRLKNISIERQRSQEVVETKQLELNQDEFRIFKEELLSKDGIQSKNNGRKFSLHIQQDPTSSMVLHVESAKSDDSIRIPVEQITSISAHQKKKNTICFAYDKDATILLECQDEEQLEHHLKCFQMLLAHKTQKRRISIAPTLETAALMTQMNHSGLFKHFMK